MLRLSMAAMVAHTLSRESELRGLAQLVRPGDICLDIGAAYGMYTFSLARLVGPTGQVHSFEPLRFPYQILESARRVAAAGHVITTNAALGPSNGRQRLCLPYRFGLPNHGWAHLETGLKNPGDGKILEVPVYSIDHICETRRLPFVTFMKVDVEGFESAVLTGGIRTIERHRPGLLLEIEERHLAKYGMTAADVAEPLLGMGYRMYIRWRGRWQKTNEVTGHRRNYLFSDRLS
ncbi:FkbM family methyltransferase [Spongiactinospora gelatinilytica]|uniref:FkbM family methyltransferase n=1 Tax=Spongiactinospora gelatinilytica TaxID=2666298 RepID=A0A2W2HWX1_9ACTN|nr:FkbM family methyltransferase [Spongiactinospora gelatinilytica]PZG56025.1 FkbM family methyltransferase [Spongiactinospora gelatinilytica]